MKLNKNGVIEHECDYCQTTIELVYPTMEDDGTIHYVCKYCFGKTVGGVE